jgi:hypothetical protein
MICSHLRTFAKIRLDYFCILCFSEIPVKAKPAARRGRKATGLLKGEEKIAGLPGRGNHGFFIFKLNRLDFMEI